MNFILDGAQLQPLGPARRQDGKTVLDAGGHRFLGIDMFSGIDGAVQQIKPEMGGGGVEKNRIGIVGQNSVQIGGPVLHIVGAGEAGQLGLVAPGQNQFRHDRLAAAHIQPALGDDRA